MPGAVRKRKRKGKRTLTCIDAADKENNKDTGSAATSFPNESGLLML